MRRRLRRSRRAVRVRRLLLAAGQEVEVPCRLRRTSSRGWGPWTDAILFLGRRGDHRAEWLASDPMAVGLTPSRATEPFPVTNVLGVTVRRSRFKEEAFHGPDTRILVVTAERSVTEVCAPPDEVDEVRDRLTALVTPPPDPT